MPAKKAAAGAAQPGTASGAKRKAGEQPSEQAESPQKKNATAPVKPGPNATDEEVEAYYENLAAFVAQRLPGAMSKLGVEVQALQTTPPTTIAHNNTPAIGGAKLTTFCEVWDVVNCTTTMKSNSKYEPQAAGCPPITQAGGRGSMMAAIGALD